MIIFLATDVEVWPRIPHSDSDGFKDDFRRFIYGPTSKGDYGLPFQLKLLAEHRLKAVFLVDSMFASVFGLSYLKEIVDLIQDAGQEVQLHIHTEWVEKIDGFLPGRRGRNIRDFSKADQKLIIEKAIENLTVCGVEDLCAFRAGNFGANWDTLEALSAKGILYDTSYNIPYIGSSCDLATDPPLVQPVRFGEIIEFPISFFEQGPRNYRHAQVGSCSYAELTSMMRKAESLGWHSFQILSHNFELLNPAKTKPDGIAVRRFKKLCRFFDTQRDRFQTGWFRDLKFDGIPTDIKSEPLRSNWFRTAWRYGEQLARRVFN